MRGDSEATGAGPSWLERLPLLKDRPWLATGCALAICIAATALRVVIEPLLPPGYPMTILIPAVAISALLFGTRAGLVAAALSTAIAWGLFVARFEAGPLGVYWRGVIVLFVAVEAFMLVLVHAIHRGTARLVAERERTARLAETRALLFRELQHRVSNNLQVASSLISLQRASVADPAARHALAEAAMRLGVIGAISRQLYDPEGAPRSLQALLEPLCADVVRASGRETVELAVDAASDIHFAPGAALPLALIVAEAVANAIEHGLAARPAGTIAVRARRDADRLVIEVEDDGAGPPSGFDLARDCGLGLRIAILFARQLEGSFELLSGNGAIARLVIPASHCA